MVGLGARLSVAPHPSSIHEYRSLEAVVDNSYHSFLGHLERGR